MEGLSNATATSIYKHIFGKTAYTAPTTIYAALAKGTVSESDTGSTFDEADYTSYARVALTNNTTNFPLPTNGAGSIGVDIEFPTATGGSNTIVEFLLLDASTAGNIIAGGTLLVSKTVTSGVQLVFQATEVEITVI